MLLITTKKHMKKIPYSRKKQQNTLVIKNNLSVNIEYTEYFEIRVLFFFKYLNILFFIKKNRL